MSRRVGATATSSPSLTGTLPQGPVMEEAITGVLRANGIRISMDGKGRTQDEVFVERFWRSLKYENIYMKGYETLKDAKAGISEYMDFYNDRRIHESLSYRTPNEVYYENIGEKKSA